MEQLRSLAAWLLEQEAEEVVMESTAQYWQSVWEALERYWKPIREKRQGASRRSGTLHLAQAQSNRGRRGRKRDFPDAERLVKRLVARELILSFVPDAEQRLWRTVTRRKYQLQFARPPLELTQQAWGRRAAVLCARCHEAFHDVVSSPSQTDQKRLWKTKLIRGKFPNHQFIHLRLFAFNEYPPTAGIRFRVSSLAF